MEEYNEYKLNKDKVKYLYIMHVGEEGEQIELEFTKRDIGVQTENTYENSMVWIHKKSWEFWMGTYNNVRKVLNSLEEEKLELKRQKQVAERFYNALEKGISNIKDKLKLI